MAEEKISTMTASSDGFNKEDLIEVSEWNGSGFVTRNKSFLQILMGLLEGKRIYVDAVNGNDGNATGSPYLPFQTISAAEAIYSTGYLIFVRAGDYSEGAIGVNDGLYWFDPGADVTYSGNIFTDAGGISYKVFGFGKFMSGQSVLYSNGAGDIELNCSHAEGTGASSRTIWAYTGSTGNKTINVTGDLVVSGQEQVLRMDAAGTVFVSCNRMIGAGGLFQVSIAGAKAICYAKEFIYEAAGDGYIGVGVTAGDVEMHGNVYLNGNGLYSLPAIVIASTGNLKVFGNIESTSGDGTMTHSSSGRSEIYGKVNSTGLIAISAGVVYVEGVFTNDVSNTEVIRLSGTGKLVNNALVKNLDASSGSSAINMTSGTPQLVSLQNARYVVDAAATYSISSTPTLNIKSYPGSVANKAIQVGTLTELIDAILIDSNVDTE
jgi:hypothetical protein